MHMNNLQSFWDFLLFGLGAACALYVIFILFNVLVLLGKGVGFTAGALFVRIAWLVVGSLLSYWLLARVTGVF